jgi:hypothetical protein
MSEAQHTMMKMISELWELQAGMPALPGAFSEQEA